MRESGLSPHAAAKQTRSFEHIAGTSTPGDVLDKSKEYAFKTGESYHPNSGL